MRGEAKELAQRIKPPPEPLGGPGGGETGPGVRGWVAQNRMTFCTMVDVFPSHPHHWILSW